MRLPPSKMMAVSSFGATPPMAAPSSPPAPPHPPAPALCASSLTVADSQPKRSMARSRPGATPTALARAFRPPHRTVPASPSTTTSRALTPSARSGLSAPRARSAPGVRALPAAPWVNPPPRASRKSSPPPRPWRRLTAMASSQPGVTRCSVAPMHPATAATASFTATAPPSWRSGRTVRFQLGAARLVADPARPPAPVMCRSSPP